MRTDNLPPCIILDTEELLDRLIWSVEPIVLTQHDVHVIVSAIIVEMDARNLEDYYENLPGVMEGIVLIDYPQRFPRLEEKHALIAAIVEFGVFFMELVIRHGLYLEGYMDPFPFMFVNLTGKAVILRRVNFT